jgi:predicted RNA binding protein YcfA (HicA-like mRNA interferase family)
MKPQVWDQLKNKTADDLIQALEKDGAAWINSQGGGSARVYRLRSGFKIAIHYHPHRTYGHKMLSDLVETTGWTEPDLKRLKLIK